MGKMLVGQQTESAPLQGDEEHLASSPIIESGGNISITISNELVNGMPLVALAHSNARRGGDDVFIDSTRQFLEQLRANARKVFPITLGQRCHWFLPNVKDEPHARWA